MTRRYYYRPWKEETLVSALHFMRCQIVRDGAEGLDHIDALLRLRGVDPDSLPMPEKRPKHFPRGKLQIAVMEALREGPMTGADLARRVQGNGLEYAAAYKRVYQCLNRMQAAGLVKREGRLWGLAQRRAS
jgi:hypothetical protein